VTTQAQSKSMPSAEEALVALESSRTLAAVLETRQDTQEIELATPSGEMKRVTVPVSALRLFIEILTQIGAGNAVSIIPVHAVLTSQEAADQLNVSRPFLIGLLESSQIPFYKIGTHRRIKYQDVIAYKERIDAARKADLAELAAQAQELKMGYE